MASYTINHTCGHASTQQLFGRHGDRERRIAWLEGRPCPDCWRSEQRIFEAAKPITVTITTNGLDEDEQHNVLAEVVLTGGTEPHKDRLKAAGYSWAEPRGGVLSLLSMSAIRRAWLKRLPLLSIHDQAPRILAEIRELDPRAVGQININPLDIEMARSRLAKRAERMAANPRPERPVWYAALMAAPGATWNGKIYGKAQYGYRIYINNVEHAISSAQADELKSYNERRLAHNTAKAR